MYFQLLEHNIHVESPKNVLFTSVCPIMQLICANKNTLLFLLMKNMLV